MNAPSISEHLNEKFLRNGRGYAIKPHPLLARLYHIQFEPGVVRNFLDNTNHINIQNLEYMPMMRFVIAKMLIDLLDEHFQTSIRAILKDRLTGGFTIGVQDETSAADDYVKISTAMSHLVGPTNYDSMSGTYYARFVVKDTDESDSYLRQAYRLFTLHTDGTFVDEPTDWLLMMKFDEKNTIGGESRLLHLDDWEELEQYSKHPFANFEFTYKSPASKNVGQTINRRTFFLQNDKPCICFIDQFVCPETIEHSIWLKNMSDSMESSAGTKLLPLPIGQMIMLNNLFWLHGRAPFEKHPNLHRELLRQRGIFSKM